MMNQAHVNEHYTAYLEGSLPEHLRQEVEEHLLNCRQCAAELAEMCRVVECLHSLPEVTPPSDFAVVVRAGLPRREPVRLPFWRAPLLAGGMLAAAAALVLALVYITPMTPLAPPDRTPLVAIAPKQTTEQDMARDEQRTRAMHIDRTKAQKPQAAGNKVKPAPVRIAAAPQPVRPEVVASPPAEQKNDESNLILAERSRSYDGTMGYTGPAAPPAAVVDRVETRAMPFAREEALTTRAGNALTITGGTSKSRTDADKTEASSDTASAGLRISSGTVNIEAQSQPDGGLVTLHLTGTPPQSLVMHFVLPAGETDRHFDLPDSSRDVVLNLPPLPLGGIITLTLQGTTGKDVLYLIAPGAGPRKVTTDLQATEQPMSQLLYQLATLAGVYVACPAAFAEDKVSVSLTSMPTLRLFDLLADQHDHHTHRAGQVVTIVPGE